MQGRFLAAPLMTVWGMGLFHVAYNGYVCESLFPYRHPERSRGILFAHWYSVLCETAEKGESCREMFENRYSGTVIPSVVEGSFLHTGISPYVRPRKGGTTGERSKKHWSARRISRCAPHDGMGEMCLFHTAYNGYVCKSLFPYRHPERSRGILLAYRYSVLCEIAEKGETTCEGSKK